MATATKPKAEAVKPTRQVLDARIAELRDQVVKLRIELSNTATDSALDFESWIARRRQISEQRLGVLREIVATLLQVQPLYSADFAGAQQAQEEAGRVVSETIERLSKSHFDRLGEVRASNGANREIVKRLVNQDPDVIEARQKHAHASSIESTLTQRIRNFTAEIAEAEKQLTEAYVGGL